MSDGDVMARPRPPPLAKERARILDVRDVVGVAQAALRAVLLGRISAAGLDGLGFLSPVRGHGVDAHRHSPRRRRSRTPVVVVVVSDAAKMGAVIFVVDGWQA